MGMEGIEPGSIGGLDCCCCPYVRLDCCEEMLLPWCLEASFRGMAFNMPFSENEIDPTANSWGADLSSMLPVIANENCTDRFDFSISLQCVCKDDDILDPSDPCFGDFDCAWSLQVSCSGTRVCIPVDTNYLDTCENLELVFTIPDDPDCITAGIDGEAITISRNRLRHCCCCCSVGGNCLVMDLAYIGAGDCGADVVAAYAEGGITEIVFNGPGAGPGPRHFGSLCRYSSASVSFRCEDYYNPLIECQPPPPGQPPPDHLELTWHAQFSPEGDNNCKLTVWAVIQETECPIIGDPGPCDYVAATYEKIINGKECNGGDWPIVLPKIQDAGSEYVSFPDSITMDIQACVEEMVMAAALYYKCSNCGHVLKSTEDLVGAVCPKCGK